MRSVAHKLAGEMPRIIGALPVATADAADEVDETSTGKHAMIQFQRRNTVVEGIYN